MRLSVFWFALSLASMANCWISFRDSASSSSRERLATPVRHAQTFRCKSLRENAVLAGQTHTKHKQSRKVQMKWCVRVCACVCVCACVRACARVGLYLCRMSTEGASGVKAEIRRRHARTHLQDKRCCLCMLYLTLRSRSPPLSLFLQHICIYYSHTHNVYMYVTCAFHRYEIKNGTNTLYNSWRV